MTILPGCDIQRDPVPFRRCPRRICAQVSQRRNPGASAIPGRENGHEKFDAGSKLFWLGWGQVKFGRFPAKLNTFMQLKMYKFKSSGVYIDLSRGVKPF